MLEWKTGLSRVPHVPLQPFCSPLCVTASNYSVRVVYAILNLLERIRKSEEKEL